MSFNEAVANSVLQLRQPVTEQIVDKLWDKIKTVIVQYGYASIPREVAMNRNLTTQEAPADVQRILEQAGKEYTKALLSKHPEGHDCHNFVSETLKQALKTRQISSLEKGEAMGVQDVAHAFWFEASKNVLSLQQTKALLPNTQNVEKPDIPPKGDRKRKFADKADYFASLQADRGGRGGRGRGGRGDGPPGAPPNSEPTVDNRLCHGCGWPRSITGCPGRKGCIHGPSGLNHPQYNSDTQRMFFDVNPAYKTLGHGLKAGEDDKGAVIAHSAEDWAKFNKAKEQLATAAPTHGGGGGGSYYERGGGGGGSHYGPSSGAPAGRGAGRGGRGDRAPQGSHAWGRGGGRGRGGRGGRGHYGRGSESTHPSSDFVIVELLVCAERKFVSIPFCNACQPRNDLTMCADCVPHIATNTSLVKIVLPAQTNAESETVREVEALLDTGANSRNFISDSLARVLIQHGARASEHAGEVHSATRGVSTHVHKSIEFDMIINNKASKAPETLSMSATIINDLRYDLIIGLQTLVSEGLIFKMTDWLVRALCSGSNCSLQTGRGRLPGPEDCYGESGGPTGSSKAKVDQAARPKASLRTAGGGMCSCEACSLL